MKSQGDGSQHRKAVDIESQPAPGKLSLKPEVSETNQQMTSGERKSG